MTYYRGLDDELTRVPERDLDEPDRSGFDWECGSCGAVIDARLAFDGEPFHAPDADCRTVEPFDANMRAAWERSGQ